jgi:hypothetical protein
MPMGKTPDRVVSPKALDRAVGRNLAVVQLLHDVVLEGAEVVGGWKPTRS